MAPPPGTSHNIWKIRVCLGAEGQGRDIPPPVCSLSALSLGGGGGRLVAGGPGAPGDGARGSSESA